MTRNPRAFVRAIFTIVTLLLLSAGTVGALAGPPRTRVRQTVVVTGTQPCAAPGARPTLGTFYSTPYFIVRGDYPTGGGYSPLEIYGDQTLALYGPLSALRATTAPVMGYVRGYDGQTHLVESVSFSYPNLPSLSPVRYPTQGNYFYGPRVVRPTFTGANAINWIDQN